ncbi:hypothetical protein [Microbacterium sp. NPDC056234]
MAAELEISVPTARRDLEALAMSGIPSTRHEDEAAGGV